MRKTVEEKLEKHYPNYMAVKLNSLIDECKDIVKKYETGHTLTNHDERTLLLVLNKTGNLEITEEVRKVEREFVKGNAIALGLGAAGALIPYLIREFH